MKIKFLVDVIVPPRIFTSFRKNYKGQVTFGFTEK